MLTLEFKDSLVENAFTRINHYYKHDERDLISAHFRFSPSNGELPYMMIAKPSLHKGGLLHISINHPFVGRSVDMKKLKEVLDFAPVAMRVNMGGINYLIGKGFIVKIPNGEPEQTMKPEILFAVVGNPKKVINSPHDLKIYLDRQLYDDQNKRIMAILKPYMSSHRGDIIVTKSVNNYLLYKFELPAFRDITSRVKFDDLMKKFFYRSIKWYDWRIKEDERIAREEKEKERTKLREEKSILLQERTLAVLIAENNRLVLTPEVEEATVIQEVGEQVDHMSLEDLERPYQVVREVAEQQLEAMLRNQQIPQTTPLVVAHWGENQVETPESVIRHHEELLQTWRLTGEGITHSQQLAQEQEQEPLLSPQTTAISPREMEQRLQSLQQEETLQEQETLLEQDQVNGIGMMEEPIATYQSVNSTAEHISEEEMMRIMSEFAIAPTEVTYAVGYDPISEVERPAGTARVISRRSGVTNAQEELRRAEYYGANLIHEEDEEGGDEELDENGEPVINEDTEFVIRDDGEEPIDEEEQERLHSSSEEDLDNDPNAYVDAEVVQSEEPEERVFRAMENGTDGG